MLPSLLVALLLVALLPAGARGHAVLKRSSLPGRVRAGAPLAVTLSFNSAVEPGLSRVLLVDADRRETPLAARAGGARNEIAVDLPGLEPGNYALRYKVLAVDGHVTESVLRFAVAAGD